MGAFQSCDCRTSIQLYTIHMDSIRTCKNSKTQATTKRKRFAKSALYVPLNMQRCTADRNCPKAALAPAVQDANMLASQYSRRVAPFTAARAQPPQRGQLVVRSAVPAKPVSVSFKGIDGSDKGTHQLALNVAPAETAKALVHRYLVLVQQNARRVCYPM